MLTDGGRVERDFPKRDKGKMDRAIDHVQGWLGDRVWFAFRHLPLTEIHPHALAAEAAALQDRFWEGSGEVRRTPTLLSTESCAVAAAARPSCSTRWRDERSLHTHRLHTIGRE
jgi:hypothetical protein